MLSRRQFLGGIAAGAGYSTLVESRWLQVTHTPIRIGNQPVGRVRILHLSDLHASWCVPWNTIEHAISLGLAARPDIACVTGDFISTGADVDYARYVQILRRLPAAVPSYATLGNHDGGRWAELNWGYSDHGRVDRLVEEAGIELLHNRARQIEVRGLKFHLAGVGDLWSDGIDPRGTFREIRTGRPVVLMSHNPDSKELLQFAPWDLMLSGHTHGGQVVVPLVGSPYIPVQDKRFIAGLHPWEGRQIFTSRGVGNFFGARLCCRPEVAILDVGIGSPNGADPRHG